MADGGTGTKIDDGPVMTEEEVYRYLRLPDADKRPEVIAGIPCVELGGGIKRYMRDVVDTWLCSSGMRHGVMRREAA